MNPALNRLPVRQRLLTDRLASTALIALPIFSGPSVQPVHRGDEYDARVIQLTRSHLKLSALFCAVRPLYESP